MEKARTLGLTPIIEELEELNLNSTTKKSQDDFTVEKVKPQLLESEVELQILAEEVKKNLD